MKKVVFLLVFMVSFFIQARIVEENDFVTNKETLENEINSLFGPPNNVTIDINRIIPLEQDGYVVGWIVNLLPEGWFIASAHTEGAPFILFSDDGSFSDPSFSDDYSLDIKEFFEIHKKYLFI